MNEEEEIKLSFDNKNLMFWKTISLLLAFIIFLTVAYYAYTTTTYYGKDLCENLNEDILEKKTLYESQCVHQRIQGVNMTQFIKEEE